MKCCEGGQWHQRWIIMCWGGREGTFLLSFLPSNMCKRATDPILHNPKQMCLLLVLFVYTGGLISYFDWDNEIGFCSAEFLGIEICRNTFKPCWLRQDKMLHFGEVLCKRDMFIHQTLSQLIHCFLMGAPLNEITPYFVGVWGGGKTCLLQLTACSCWRSP